MRRCRSSRRDEMVMMEMWDGEEVVGEMRW